jgi:hypothetical protein
MPSRLSLGGFNSRASSALFTRVRGSRLLERWPSPTTLVDRPCEPPPQLPRLTASEVPSTRPERSLARAAT